ncbi:hypothetical protein Tco_0870702 [Tanacetum coccineum]
MDVDAPQDIIDADEEDNFINDEDVLPYDLEDFDDEDLANDDDDDDVVMMLADVARGHGGDGGRGGRKPNRRGRKAGRLRTRGETRNLGLRRITDK